MKAPFRRLGILLALPILAPAPAVGSTSTHREISSRTSVVGVNVDPQLAASWKLLRSRSATLRISGSNLPGEESVLTARIALKPSVSAGAPWCITRESSFTPPPVGSGGTLALSARFIKADGAQGELHTIAFDYRGAPGYLGQVHVSDGYAAESLRADRPRDRVLYRVQVELDGPTRDLDELIRFGSC